MRRWLIAVALLGGCTSSSSPIPDGTFSQIYPLLFPVHTRAQCNFCHSLPPNDVSNGKLSMGEDQATAYAGLMATSQSSKCGHAQQLVVPGDASASLLYQKLTNPTCGGKMPLGGSPLTAVQLEMVRTWIDNGAQDD